MIVPVPALNAPAVETDPEVRAPVTLADAALNAPEITAEFDVNPFAASVADDVMDGAVTEPAVSAPVRTIEFADMVFPTSACAMVAVVALRDGADRLWIVPELLTRMSQMTLDAKSPEEAATELMMTVFEMMAPVVIVSVSMLLDTSVCEMLQLPRTSSVYCGSGLLIPK